MISSKGYSHNLRGIYLGYLIKLLNKKYFVSMSPIAKELDMNSNYFRDFARGLKNMPNEKLDLIEDFLYDLYGAILIDEVPQKHSEFQEFITTLPNSLIYKEIVN
ncbi:hypothetical protein [Liquorilactobacillus hordei]|uniref:HTH cro/C1-type domain-containing protein n=1 Tax=Liquorilactobacillus hordei DSM 19519 TaxID=1423759 RepID=A0A0R1MRY0_9LACO|nr:hypothetical protein [Liquorilactobacillus hordei]KRL07909.1 hypothetical protein FC92_GL000976 [Liquorilactobacillus hordei DSM 19519]QYH50997.1 hypothetical protein G6O70_00080 [Liquorilactobacillus hordei DSM 19519]QYH51144.1 hypothetical protein G6O70_00875 [Liquorilactobacillus hordei DSM 19519]